MPNKPERKNNLQHEQRLQLLFGLRLPAQAFQRFVAFTPHTLRLAAKQGLQQFASLNQRAEPSATHLQRLLCVILQRRKLFAGEKRPLSLGKRSITRLVGERFDPSS